MHITLPDSRTLAYAEYGDPDGWPLFFFHDIPGSRLFRPPDEITAQMGARLITIDRPGYGLSTFQPGRTFTDWPRDVAALADHLGLARFAVAGHSGGGLAQQFGPGECARHLQRVAARQPHGAKGRALDALSALAAGHAGLLWQSRPARRSALPRPRQPAPHHTRPWGFRLQEILIPVYLWRGPKDVDAAPQMGQFIAGKIPACRVTLLENEGHLLLFSHWQDILAQLAPETT